MAGVLLPHSGSLHFQAMPDAFGPGDRQVRLAADAVAVAAPATAASSRHERATKSP